MRGGSLILGAASADKWGLSPRARGKLDLDRRTGWIHGSIPACAGEAVNAAVITTPIRVYPRVRGGSGTTLMRNDLVLGLSPRARGKLRNGEYPIAVRGSIPACAGEARCPANPSRRRQVYPRVRGGSGEIMTEKQLSTGLSPRARGKPTARQSVVIASRSIPACAGEASLETGTARPPLVYPRVRGGSTPLLLCYSCYSGLSPRARGKQHGGRSQQMREGSIPACAGEAGYPSSPHR